VRLSELLGLRIHTESGERLGRVHDVRGELTPRTLRVTGLVVGRIGLLERFGLPALTSNRRVRTDDLIAWNDVIRVDRRGVVIRDGSDPG
jgi:sporulation protein YlmC with PRC-barrel domain